MTLSTKIFDAADYLTDGELVFHFLNDTLNDPSSRMVSASLQIVARARGGVPRLAEESGVSAEEIQRVIDGDSYEEKIAVTRKLTDVFRQYVPSSALVA